MVKQLSLTIERSSQTILTILFRKQTHQHSQSDQADTNKSPPGSFGLLFNIIEGFAVAFGHLVRLTYFFTKITLADCALTNRENGNPEYMEVFLENVYVHGFSVAAMCALLR